MTDVPVTETTPGFMVIVRPGKPVTTQLSVLVCPGLIFDGVAVRPVMAGGFPARTVTAAVVDPKEFVAVSV